MTCEDVRERLLSGPVADIPELAPHLERCPECRELSVRVGEADQLLRDHVEAFVNRPTSLDAVFKQPPPRSNRRLFTGLVGLAVAATLALVLGRATPIEEPTVHAATPALLQARDAAGVFEAIGFPEAEDEALRKGFGAKAEAFNEATDAFEAVLTDADDVTYVVALLELAELHVAMGQWLEALPSPSYLNERQSEVYVAQIGMKAAARYDAARELLDEARTFAESAQVNEFADRISAQAQELDELPTVDELAAKVDALRNP